MSHGKEGPKFMFSDRALEKLCHPWSNALIIKLLNEKDDNSHVTADHEGGDMIISVKGRDQDLMSLIRLMRC